jgi:alkanesulfonate monooxygenase SsuD/methylene tetrahydromethanopterin reductase-like flavin-dependent oxidoreductase (luciferase family)
VTAILPPMHEVHERNLFEIYASVSGRKLGDGMAMLRDIIIADSDEEARQLWADSATFAGNAWFVPFGFRRGMLDPETGEAPSPDEAIAKGYALVGTVDSVTRSLEALLRKLPVNWIFGWTHNTLVPHDKLMRSIEQFHTRVLPRVS